MKKSFKQSLLIIIATTFFSCETSELVQNEEDQTNEVKKGCSVITTCGTKSYEQTNLSGEAEVQNGKTLITVKSSEGIVIDTFECELETGVIVSCSNANDN
jgi:hypothetical protein